jgi:acyl-CoA reductase-like NAD-dependent aldehyde dehydrogenase
VLSPHPSAAKCITRVAEVLCEAACAAGAPDGSVGWMTNVTLAGTQELMQHRGVSVILATGGMGLVRAAYSAGKPAYGVGPGNAPCYIDAPRTSRKAANDILTANRSTTACSARRRTPSSSTAPSRTKRAAVHRAGRIFPVGRGADALAKPARHAAAAAESEARRQIRDLHRAAARHHRAANTRALIAELKGVGPRLPALDRKALPRPLVLRRQRLARRVRTLQGDPPYGGMGHTMSIHSQNEDVILEFGSRNLRTASW